MCCDESMSGTWKMTREEFLQWGWRRSSFFGGEGYYKDTRLPRTTWSAVGFLHCFCSCLDTQRVSPYPLPFNKPSGLTVGWLSANKCALSYVIPWGRGCRWLLLFLLIKWNRDRPVLLSSVMQLINLVWTWLSQSFYYFIMYSQYHANVYWVFILCQTVG